MPLLSKSSKNRKKKMIGGKKKVKTKIINYQQDSKIINHRSKTGASLKIEETIKIFKHNMNLIKVKTIKSTRISRTKTSRINNCNCRIMAMPIKKLDPFKAFFRARAKTPPISKLEISRLPLKLTPLLGFSKMKTLEGTKSQW